MTCAYGVLMLLLAACAVRADTSVTADGPALNVTVAQLIPAPAGSSACAVRLSSTPPNTLSISPLTVTAQPGVLTLGVVLDTSQTQLLNLSAGSAGVNPQASQGQGLTSIAFNASQAAAGANATLYTGLFQANASGIDPSSQAPLCTLNITFVAAGNAPSPAPVQAPALAPAAAGSPPSNPSATFTTATGTTTPLPAGIPVTTGNVKGSNRGYGNSGSNNIGNGNTGDCNQGDGNVGFANRGEGNRGDCNIGNGNVGNGWVGDGNINPSTNGPNYPCTCTLNAVAGTTTASTG